MILEAKNIVEVKLNFTLAPGGSAKTLTVVEGRTEEGVTYAILDDGEFAGVVQADSQDEAMDEGLKLIAAFVSYNLRRRGNVQRLFHIEGDDL